MSNRPAMVRIGQNAPQFLIEFDPATVQTVEMLANDEAKMIVSITVASSAQFREGHPRNGGIILEWR
jgi:hypothetical protein